MLALAPIVASGQPDSATTLPAIGYIQRPMSQLGFGAALGVAVGLSRNRWGDITVPIWLAPSTTLNAPRLFGEDWGLLGRIELSQFSYGPSVGDTPLDVLRLALLGTMRLPAESHFARGYLGIGPFVGPGIVDGHSNGIYDIGMGYGWLMLLSFPVSLKPNTELAPELRMRMDLSAIGHTEVLPLIDIGAGLTLYFTLHKLSPVRRVLDLSATVELYAFDEQGKRTHHPDVRDGSFARSRHLELAPVLTFDSSSNLFSRYVTRSASDRVGFRLDSILRLDPAIVDRHRPDLLGTWLARDRGAIRLIATVVEGESEKPPRSRAESVRRYLSGTWGIDTARMAIAVEPGHRREVRIESGLGEVVSFDAAWSEPRMVVPTVRVEPGIDSEAGVKGWRLRLEREGREVAVATSDPVTGLAEMKRLMGRLERDPSPSPLIGELIVEDKVGTLRAARDTLFFHHAGKVALGRSVEYLMLGASPPPDLATRIAGVADSIARVVIIPLSRSEASRDAAMAAVRELHEAGVEARVGLPESEAVEGVRVEVITSAAVGP
jgi:hypothetical protein